MKDNPEAILIVEDTEQFALWQIRAMHQLFPDKDIIHVTNLEDAQEILKQSLYHIVAVMTDNGYPLVPGGSRCGSKSSMGGAGTLLVKQIREGYFGEKKRNLPVIWHTSNMTAEKSGRVLRYDGETYTGMTYCFAKGDGVEPFVEMGKCLVH